VREGWLMGARGYACCAVCALVFGAAAQQEYAELGNWLKDPAAWALAPEAFVGAYQAQGFRFVDGRQTAVSREKAMLRFLGRQVCEARVYFAENAVRRVELSVYNKGDAGALDREAFERLVGELKRATAAVLGDAGLTGKTSNDRANYFVKRHLWVKRATHVQLEWAYVDQHRSGGVGVPYGAEYVAVLMMPGRQGGDGATALGGGLASTRPKGARAIRENVVRCAGGDVRIENVPMVDQGQKGYCAAASSERVLRYYGLEVDQHQVAQLANTAAEGGTTLEGMAKAIGKIGRQFQLDKKDLISSETDGSFERSDHVKLIELYNETAGKRRKPTVDWHAYVQNNMVDLLAVWRAMDPDVLRETRNGQRQAKAQFQRYVKSYVDQGVPLLWSCLVGQYREDPPLGGDGVFGHVRLIIGYNDATREVLYSDAWGPQHALKRLPLDDVWAMTKGLIVLKPRDVR